MFELLDDWIPDAFWKLLIHPSNFFLQPQTAISKNHETRNAGAEGFCRLRGKDRPGVMLLIF